MISLLKLIPSSFSERCCLVLSCSIKKRRGWPSFLSIILTCNPSASPVGFTFKIYQHLPLLSTCMATMISKLDPRNILRGLPSCSLVPTVNSTHSSQSELAQDTRKLDRVTSFFIKLQWFCIMHGIQSRLFTLAVMILPSLTSLDSPPML